mmetsp:Transcript_25356/g.69741  ORF Transcript_25356/g.69741 Transcript_25356/m.69741 type:complete len:202 (-) Transcript_25356:621-1226(-)
MPLSMVPVSMSHWKSWSGDSFSMYPELTSKLFWQGGGSPQALQPDLTKCFLVGASASWNHITSLSVALMKRSLLSVYSSLARTWSMSVVASLGATVVSGGATSGSADGGAVVGAAVDVDRMASAAGTIGGASGVVWIAGDVDCTGTGVAVVGGTVGGAVAAVVCTHSWWYNARNIEAVLHSGGSDGSPRLQQELPWPHQAQ